MFSEPFSEGMYYLLFVFFSRTGKESNLADVGIEFNAAVIRVIMMPPSPPPSSPLRFFLEFFQKDFSSAPPFSIAVRIFDTSLARVGCYGYEIVGVGVWLCLYVRGLIFCLMVTPYQQNESSLSNLTYSWIATVSVTVCILKILFDPCNNYYSHLYRKQSEISKPLQRCTCINPWLVQSVKAERWFW